jgi:hypothetical protein
MTADVGNVAPTTFFAVGNICLPRLGKSGNALQVYCFCYESVTL